MGIQTRLQTQNIPQQVIQHPQAFPIKPIQQQFYYQTSIITRTQFPLLPAYATTTYKCQGRSMQRVIAHVQYIIQPRYNTTPQSRTITSDHLYVACSRCTRGTDLLLFPELPNIQQSDRQRQVTQILNNIPRYNFHLPQLPPSNSNYTMAFHNGQGCANKLDHYSNDTFYLNLDILCLMELHSPLNIRSVISFTTFIELPGLQRNGSGMAIFIKSHIVHEHLTSQRFIYGNAAIEIITISLRNTILLTFIYCNPHVTPRFLREIIDHIMEIRNTQTQPPTTIHFFGDFNQSCDQENQNYFQYQYGLLLQQPTVATHRSGSYIDKALSNMPLDLHIRPTYWSDHSTLWCSFEEN